MPLPRNSYFAASMYVAIGIVAVVFLKAASETAHAQATGATHADPEREAAWNSPEMLRARAWVNEYAKNKDNVSEAEAAANIQALQSMTAGQMKLLATMHDSLSKSHPTSQTQLTHAQALQHARQAAAAQKWWYDNVHKAEMQRALAADHASQQVYNDINQEETGAANEAQKQFDSEQAFARENQQDKLDELNSPYYYGDAPYGGLWGYPGVHYHFHMYP